MAAHWPDGGVPGFAQHSPALDMGVALLDGKLQLRTADARTLDLLGATSVEEGRGIWADQVRDLISSASLALDGQSRAGRSELRLVVRGNGRPLRIDLRRLEDGGHEDHAALIQDETMLDSLEQEARLANRLRGIFFFHRALVHDLRGHLHNLALVIELLAGEASGEMGPGSARDRVGMLKRGLAQLSGLLDSLLAHTAPPREEVERFDVRAVMDEIQLLLETQAKLQHVTTRVRLPPSAVLMEGRRGDLRQAYLGVFISALAAIPSGGEVSVTVDSEPAGGCTLTVASTLSASDERRMQAGVPTAQEPRSNLRVVESIVGSLGGRLLHESGASAGAKITLLLPGAPPQPHGH